jgi:two-component system OmpR family response regulator
MQNKPSLLLIEDNASISAALSEALKNDYNLECVQEGKAGLYKSDQEQYDVILLDLNLPDVPGLAVCQQMRERGVCSPIFIVSGETNVLSKINLFDAGANDYLTKPFSLGELKARLRALIRTSKENSSLPSHEIEIGSLTLNPTTFSVCREGKAISLRRKEFSLLHCLMAHAGTVVPRETLIRYGWDGLDTPWANTLDVHIKYLRDKLDRPYNSSAIKTVHGIGYRLDLNALTKERVDEALS